MAARATTPTWTAAAIFAGSLCPSRSDYVGSFLAPLKGAGQTTSSTLRPKFLTSTVPTQFHGPAEQTLCPVTKPGLREENTRTIVTARGTAIAEIMKWCPATALTVIQELEKAEKILLRNETLTDEEKRNLANALFVKPSSREEGRKILEEIVEGVIKKLPLLKDHFDVKALPDGGGNGLVLRARKLPARKEVPAETEGVENQNLAESEEVALTMVPASTTALNEMLASCQLNRPIGFPGITETSRCPSSGSFEGVYRDNDNRRMFLAIPENLEGEQQQRYQNKMVHAVRACHQLTCVHGDIKLDKFFRRGDEIRLLGFREPKRHTGYNRKNDIHALGVAIGRLAMYNNPSSETHSPQWPRSGPLRPLLRLLKKMIHEDPKKRPLLKDVSERLEQLRSPPASSSSSKK